MKIIQLLAVSLLFFWFFVNCDLDETTIGVRADELSHTYTIESNTVIIKFNGKIFYDECSDYIKFYKIEDSNRIELIQDPFIKDKSYYVDDTYYNESYHSDSVCTMEEYTETDVLEESLLFAQVIGQKEAPNSSDIVNVYSFIKANGNLEFELIHFVDNPRAACTLRTFERYTYTGSIEVNE